MVRPRKCRCVTCKPGAYYFKPRGIPLTHLEEVVLTLDELEALRLADFERAYHEEAASRMGISRATFGRIVEQARRKVAEALRIETLSEEGSTEHESRVCRSKG
jgi:predicted DNA-binding protein (UPF0251 family)